MYLFKRCYRWPQSLLWMTFTKGSRCYSCLNYLSRSDFFQKACSYCTSLRALPRFYVILKNLVLDFEIVVVNFSVIMWFLRSSRSESGLHLSGQQIS